MKHNKNTYTWAGIKCEEYRGIANDIRVIQNEQIHPFYQAEIENCKELGILGDRAFEQINMAAGNYYFGPGSSYIDCHCEHEKFDGLVINISYGESTFLSIGMQRRSSAMGITAIPTKSGSVIAYEVGSITMDYIPHSVTKMHLTWKERSWRLVKLLRHVREKNVSDAQTHHKTHVLKDKGNPETAKTCNCVGKDKGPWNQPFGDR